jgi:hypothetical protein
MLFAVYYWVDQFKEDKMGKASSMNGRVDIFMYNFSLIPESNGPLLIQRIFGRMILKCILKTDGVKM